MDKARNNVVVSRRAVLEDSRSEARVQLMSRLSEGEVVDGVVKNVTDYGAFIDLGGIDGLLHVTDISWKRVNHPSEALKVGETIKVQVVRFNKDTGRISLSMKHLEDDPWRNVNEKFIIGQKYKGKVVNLADYGAFIELEDGIEGLIYVTELSWTQKNILPSHVFAVNDEIEVVVLEVDEEKRRVSLSYKRCFENPWLKFQEDFPVGSIIDGIVRKVTEFGIFIGVNSEMDGIVHLKDISWKGEESEKQYKKDEVIKVKVLSIDPERERISLGIKQLESDPFESVTLKKGDSVEVKVKHISDRGVDVVIPSLDDLCGFIKRSDLSRTDSRVMVGDIFEAKFLSFDKGTRRVSLSVRALEKEEMEAAVSSMGGNEKETLGSVLEEAMRNKDLR
jgi:small subunit ribosomal protein S1